MRGFVSGLRVLCCHANKYENANNCWYLGTCEHDGFHAGKSEHETGIFRHFYEKSSATSWRYVYVNVMSNINRNKYKMVEQRLCS